MRILLADNQTRVRFALRVLLTQRPGLQVVGEASDSPELFAQAGAVDADLVLLDWELPGLTEAGGLPARSWASWRAFHPDEPDEKCDGWTG